MKFIVIGLGYFGSKLATSLTAQGHEVIGIDNRWERIDELKDSITQVMVMDTTNERAVQSLPLDDTDAVIVAIGEDVGSSILTLSILKNLNVKRVVGRVISPLHQTILHQIGIEETIHPEEDTAISLISSLQLQQALRITEIDSEHIMAELFVPEKYVGHTPETMNLDQRFGLKLIAIKPEPVEKGVFSKIKKSYSANLDFDIHQKLKRADILVIVGKLKQIQKFCE